MNNLIETMENNNKLNSLQREIKCGVLNTTMFKFKKLKQELQMLFKIASEKERLKLFGSNIKQLKDGRLFFKDYHTGVDYLEVWEKLGDVPTNYYEQTSGMNTNGEGFNDYIDTKICIYKYPTRCYIGVTTRKEVKSNPYTDTYICKYIGSYNI